MRTRSVRPHLLRPKDNGSAQTPTPIARYTAITSRSEWFWKVTIVMIAFYLLSVFFLHTKQTEHMDEEKLKHEEFHRNQHHHLHQQPKIDNFEQLSGIENIHDKVRQALGGAAIVHSCRWLVDRMPDENERIQNLCNNANKLVYYNPFNKPRYLCDGTETIDAMAVLEVDNTDICNGDEPPRLYQPKDLRKDQARDLTPIRLGSSCPVKTGGKLFADCDIPCYDASPGGGVINTRCIDGTNWKFVFSMEGPQYYSNLIIGKDAWKSNRYYATTSYKSEIPLPYYSKAEYDIQAKAVDYDTAIHAAVFLAKNCNSRNEREKVVKELQESSFRIDSLSHCLHNAEPPPGIRLSGKKELIMQKYLFYLAFENQNEDDYITEKLWGPLQAGTVPVYYGAPNAKEHVPDNSVIFVNDFESIDKLAEHLQKLANDRDLYNSYHAWRTQPLPPHFHVKYDLTDTHSTCRMCRWAFAKTFGLGWDHVRQDIVELQMGPRRVCLDEDTWLIQQPFLESWLDQNRQTLTATTGANLGDDACKLTSENNQVIVRTAEKDDVVKRTVYNNDGLVDLYLEADGRHNAILQLFVPLVENVQPLKSWREGVHYLQTDVSRVTVMTMPVTADVTAANTGLLEIVMPVDRVRIVIEDVDTFHQGANEAENYFGKLVTDDFFRPVEVFVRDG